MPRDLFSRSMLAVGLLIMAAVPGAQAQKDDQEEGRRRPPPAAGPAGIVLYSDTGLRGTSVELTGDMLNFNTIRLNDKDRSVEVKAGILAPVFGRKPARALRIHRPHRPQPWRHQPLGQCLLGAGDGL